MTPREIFKAYARERKVVAPAGYRLDRLHGLIRLTPLAPDLDGVVMFSELTDTSVEDAISEQIDYFRSLGRTFEWKVYSFDNPPDLRQRLEARGFAAGDPEALMVLSIDAWREPSAAHSFRIERIHSEEGVDHVVSVQQEVWRRPFPWLKRSLCAVLERAAVFCAYVDEVPVGTGWIEFPEQSSFAELHGGAVLPQQQSRGIYSALFMARVLEAKARHCRFVAVDAAPMSRPILLRKGFIHVCDTVPFYTEG